jgi:hypothetical protein
MYLDTSKSNDNGGGHMRLCHSCSGVIGPDDAIEQVHFDADGHGLEKMNGIYHAVCAKPILSVKRAYDALSRWRF